MLNIIWPLFIIISLIYAIFFGRVSEVNLSIFDSVENAVQISINLLGTICLWNGIIKIAMNTELVDKLKRLLKPILKVLFPEIKEKDQAYSEDRLSNSMAMFIIINTASIQIIPTTVIAIRTSLGSKNPTGMILAVWIATIGAAVSAIIMSKILMKRW